MPQNESPTDLERLAGSLAGVVMAAMELVEPGHASMYDDPDEQWLLQELPLIARRLARTDRAWLVRFARGALDLMADIGAGVPPEPRCTGEEVALRLAIRNGWSGRGEVDLSAGVDLREALCQDFDVDMLWNPQLDGIEGDVQACDDLRTVHLAPIEWFEWFDNMEPRR